MIRRRRPVREIPFNLDCFLDVITNVVGIIIRLILVAWVGGRAYHAVREALPHPAAETTADVRAEEAVRRALPRQQQELTQTEQRLQSQRATLEQLRGSAAAAAAQLAQLKREEEQLD